MGYLYFFALAGLMAGASLFSLFRILVFKREKKFASCAVVLLPLLFGYAVADVTLYGFYERHVFTGPVIDWLVWCGTAFITTGVAPAVVFFNLLNRSVAPTREKIVSV